MWGDKLPILWLHRAVRMGKYLYRENLPPPILTVLISGDGEATGLLITDQDRDDSLKVHVVSNIVITEQWNYYHGLKLWLCLEQLCSPSPAQVSDHHY